MHVVLKEESTTLPSDRYTSTDLHVIHRGCRWTVSCIKGLINLHTDLNRWSLSIGSLARCRPVYGRSELLRCCCPTGRRYWQQRNALKYILYHCDIIRRRPVLIRIHPAEDFYPLSLFARWWKRDCESLNLHGFFTAEERKRRNVRYLLYRARDTLNLYGISPHEEALHLKI